MNRLTQKYAEALDAFSTRTLLPTALASASYALKVLAFCNAYNIASLPKFRNSPGLIFLSAWSAF